MSNIPGASYPLGYYAFRLVVEPSSSEARLLIALVGFPSNSPGFILD
jgi:hypothetical protein